MANINTNKSLAAENGALSMYLKDIEKIPLIGRDEEYDLAIRAKNGDAAARERLVNGNLRFVVSIAKQFQGRGLPLIDLISEGNIGLLTAIDKFEPEKGYHFISYAVWWIRQSIMQALAEQSRIVRLPLNQVGAVNKINRAVNRFEQEHERKPSTQELSDDVDLPVDKIDEAMAANTRHVSMDAPFSDSDDSSLLDLLANDDIPDTDRSLVDESLKTEVSQALMTLSERERNIVKAFFGIGQPEMTLDEIGMKFGLTRERVRQIKEKALRHLRNNSKHNTLKGYLGQ